MEVHGATLPVGRALPQLTRRLLLAPACASRALTLRARRLPQAGCAAAPIQGGMELQYSNFNPDSPTGRRWPCACPRSRFRSLPPDATPAPPPPRRPTLTRHHRRHPHTPPRLGPGRAAAPPKVALRAGSRSPVAPLRDAPGSRSRGKGSSVGKEDRRVRGVC
jgi:hypothetical protein